MNIKKINFKKCSNRPGYSLGLPITDIVLGDNMKVNIKAKTDGSGFWNDRKRTVTITDIETTYNQDLDYDELRVYFTEKSWNTEIHGLIYTDRLWIQQFRKGLNDIGFSKKAIEDMEYSEQGMQGDNYVSMDVGSDFLIEWSKFKE